MTITTVIIILVVLYLLGFIGNGVYSNGNAGYYRNGGIGLGGIVLFILVLWLLGVIH